MKWYWWIESYCYMRDMQVLPGEGGYHDQDWKYMEIYNIIRSAIIKEQNREQSRGLQQIRKRHGTI